MIEYSETLAKKYNSYHAREKHLEDLQIKKIATYLKYWENTSIIDIGCGSGRLLTKLGEYFNVIYGVEKSKEMFDCIPISELKNTAIFSYSLHQIGKTKEEQIDLLYKTFSKFGCKKILLITSSRSQFKESFLNTNIPSIQEIDLQRFLFKDELEKYFNIELYEEETNCQRIPTVDYIEMIQNKYISTLKLIKDVEIEEFLKSLEGTSEVLISDYYTYITLELNK